MIHHKKHKRTKNTKRNLFCLLCTFVVFVVNPLQLDKILGRWDLTINGADGSYPSWLEVARSGDQLSGRFVGRWGAVQPVKSIRFDGAQIDFVIDRVAEDWPHDLIFKGKLTDGRLDGTTRWNSEEQHWTAARAPSLARTGVTKWGKPISLLDGPGLTGWRVYPPTKASKWAIEDGVLANTASGANLVTERKFDDFRIQFEFKIDAGSDSGVY